MDCEEGHQLLGDEDDKEEIYVSKHTKSFSVWYSRILGIILGTLLALPIIYLIAAHLIAAHAPASKPTPESKPTPHVERPSQMPFSGPFARFPTISALPERQRRMTIVGAWNDDSTPDYLHHFFYSIQLNADVLDLLMIDRRLTNASRCADFEKAGMNITWGGNIKVHCMDNQEWKRRHVDFMCSSEYGWNCNATEYKDVTEEYRQRKDERNYNWRPFRGYAFRDLFVNQDNPFWAWLDHDLYVGNFARYPFNILSQVSLVTANSRVTEGFFMAGQLTAFNLDDPALGTAWKKFPELKSPAHFTKYIDGKMPESSEERYWTYGYLRSVDDLPGVNLSYGILLDIYGDDYIDGRWNQADAKEIFVISGRDILLVSKAYTRKHIEELIFLERSEPIDNLGSVGWTTGQHAMIDDDIMPANCSVCVTPHPFTLSDPPTLRSSYIRFKEDQPGHLWRRLERDVRRRGYERKLMRHHLKTKKEDWFGFPPFPITEDMVLRYNSGSVEVFRMGELNREKTIFYRKKGEKSIG